MIHHNNVDCSLKFNKCISKKSGYEKFEYSDGDMYMDTNSLDLFTAASSSELSVPATMASQFPICPNRYVRALVLEVTHACQLRCKYCYVSQYYDEMSTVMEFDTAKEAIDTLVDSRAVERYTLRIGFFGGEALLNFPLIQQVVSYAKEKFGSKVGFNITTNCCALTPAIADYLASEDFAIVASIDGPASIHNKNRKDVNGKGTHAKVMAGLKMLKKAGVTKVSLRATYLPDMTKLLIRTKYLNKLCDEGYGISASIEPAFLTETPCVIVPPEHKFTSSVMIDLALEYEEVSDYLATRLQQGKPAHFKNIMVYAQRLLYRQPSPSECGAGVGFMAVNPDGFIFACHREMNSLIGNLSEGGISEELRAQWVENRWYNIPKCKRCSYRNVCGGPCREHSIGATKSIQKCDPIACEFKKMWIRSGARVISKVPPMQRMELIPRKGSSHKLVQQRINLVREAGGVGDIISIGAAAAQCKLKYPDAHISMCVPNEFVEIGEHLSNVDSVIGLGPLEYLVAHRRSRGETFDPRRHLYLTTLPKGDFIDLWCPATVYERTETERIKYTRSQIFAAQAGCTELDSAVPEWRVTKPEKLTATKQIAEAFPTCAGPLVGFAPRGTKAASCLTDKFMEALIKHLKRMRANVVYFDCVKPKSCIQEHVKWFNTDFCSTVAIAEQCDIIITVDTSILHVAAALQIPALGIFSLTDGLPYKDLYPNLTVVQVEDALVGRCEMPCNRSVSKGYSEVECKDACFRMDMLNIDDVVSPLKQVLLLASDPRFQQARMERIVK